MKHTKKKNRNEKAIIYTRVSTDEQAEKGYSLRDQKDRLEKYCQINEIDICAHFQDDASAKTFKRPAFEKLLHLLQKKRSYIDLLLFVKWDRFSRNISESYRMLNLLRDNYGIRAQAVEQPIDSTIPEQKMMLAFYLSAPEVENDRRSY